MNLINNKIFKNYISFLIPLFLIEIIFKFISKMNIIDWSLLRIFISSNIIALIISIIVSFFKESIGKVISIIIMFMITIYALAQVGFLNFLGVYMSINTSSQLNAVKDYVTDFLDSFKMIYYLFLIPFIIFVFYKLFLEKYLFHKTYLKDSNIFSKRDNRKRVLISIVAIILLCFMYNLTLNLNFMQNKIQLESNKSLFRNPTNVNISMNQFGPTLFAYLDIKTSIIKPQEEIVFFSENKEKPVEEVTDYTRVIDDTEWELIDEATTDVNYKMLNSYFMNRDITDKNEYTGMFKDKNLIVIMMESTNEIFINPTYYPTFYKMYTEGLSFRNSYSPRNSCATMNNEMSGMISLYTIYKNCTANVYQDNKYSESIFGLFNKAGYKTSSYHNYDETYYFRSNIHKNMGSMNFYGAADLNIEITPIYEEWPSDVDLINEAMSRIDTDNKFMAWMTTVTTHQPFAPSSTYGDKYLDLFNDTNYTMPAKRYMSKLKELDLALERLLEILEEKDILDDTVIVLYGDHYPYGLDKDSIAGVLGNSVLEKNNIEKTPFVIYNSKVKQENFNVYTSYMNILPTIANLFDLDYDPRFYMGEDILSDDYLTSYKNRVVFTDGSWENEFGWYNATNGTVTYFKDKTYTTEEIITFNKEINDMIKMSNLAITTNYFNYLSKEQEK